MTPKFQSVSTEQMLFRRVKNHVTRGQYDGVSRAFNAATTPSERVQFSAGFLSGTFSVIADARTRAINNLLHYLYKNPHVAQSVMPVQNKDPHLKQKLTLIFFVAHHDMQAGTHQGLAQNAIKDFTPGIWDQLIASSELHIFGSSLYQAVNHRNNMLEKFHAGLTDRQFLDFCNHGRNHFPGRKKLDSGQIAQLIKDRADFLDMDIAEFIKDHLQPAWKDYTNTQRGRSEIDMGMEAVLRKPDVEKLGHYNVTRHYIK